MFDGILSGVIGVEAATLLNSFIEKQGGLQNVVSQFEKNGFGDTMKSWISQGQNLPIT
ncbi:MAG: YidB family protein, partial [Pseudomonadota bacterium]|nr:YidB family protein [Pseudomonadota bacterium]